MILESDGDVKLLDFGLAKFIEANVMQELLTEGPTLHPLAMTAPTLDGKSGLSDAEQRPVSLNQSLERSAQTDSQAGTSSDEENPSAWLADTSPRVQVQPQPVKPLPAAANGGGMSIAGNDQVIIADRESEHELRRTSGIKGTPLYMAPEVLNGEPASRRSDIYSIGALLYELCVGSPPHYDPLASLEDLRNSVNSRDAMPLAGLVPNIEPRFAAVIERCLRRRPSDRYSSGEELREALEQIADTTKKDEIPAGNPYRGLLPFEAEHRSLFFGRKSEIGTLVDRLRTEAFLLVAADSGVGKSSLCRAGVLPLVEEGGLGGNRNFRPVTLVPGRRPLASLAAALSRVLALDEEDLLEQLRRDPSQLSRMLNRQFGSFGTEGGIILFIDQMEELVTIGDWQEVVLVGEALAALSTRCPNVRLLATVRSDFLARLATVPELGDEISRALYILRPLSPEKIREVIVGPAHKKGVSFESETLVNKIVASTASADGGLPLLQFALAELWDVKNGDVITAQALDSIGGVEGALARHADHVIGRMPPEQRVSARRILMNLVTLEGTRARRLEEELVRDGAAARGALESLVRGRLLVARDTPEGAAYEVAHEALIKGWDTLRKWLEEYAESRAVKHRLETAVADWLRLGRPKEVLWSGRQVAETRHLERHDIGQKEQEFLSASSRQAERRKRERQLLIISVPVVLIALFVSVRMLAARDLDKRVIATLSDGRNFLAAGQDKAKKVQELRQQAFALFDQMKRDAGEEVWTEARKQATAADRDFSDAAGRLESGLALDPGRADVKALLADALFARVLVAEQSHSEAVLRDLLQRLPLYDEGGARMKQLQAPGHVTISSEPSGARVLLEQYVADDKGRLMPSGRKELGTTPLPEFELAAGSYLLTVGPLPGRLQVAYPFVIERGERLAIEVPQPVAAAMPPDFAYIPPGRFLFGTSGEETLRTKFFNALPAHPITLAAFLIAKHETTYAEYIEFLNARPADGRAPYLPMVGTSGVTGRIELQTVATGRWQIVMQFGTAVITAQDGDPIVYTARQQNPRQNWLRLPVAGISRPEAEAYAAWLNKSGRLLGARLCTEQEWERAARGADDREYPNGNQSNPAEANFDETYGKKPEAMGPDEVGAHPASRSPFGVDDMFGNIFELTASSLASDETVVRGGSFQYDTLTGRSINRNVIDAKWRAADVGLRLCAPVPLGSDHPG